MESALIIVIVLFLLVGVIIALAFSHSTKEASPSSNYNNITTFELSFGDKRDSHHNSFMTKIAGVTHWNTSQDIGSYWGCIYHDKNNQYDKNAIAIFSVDGKRRGFIPKGQTEELRKWCDRNYLPCIFYIAKGDDAQLYGNALIIDSDQEGVKAAVLRQTKWLVENYGVKFVPKGLDFNFDGDTPKTKKQWVDFLDELITNCEY